MNKYINIYIINLNLIGYIEVLTNNKKFNEF